jgi:transmembrane sensor
MSNLVQLPNRRNVREVAAAWLICLEEGLTDSERGELNAWLAADAAHGEALVEMARKWDAFDALSELAEIVPLHSRRAAAPRFNWKLGAVAASVVAVVAVAGWFALRPSGVARGALAPVVARSTVSEGQPVEEAAAGIVDDEKLQTTVGKQLTSHLVDGSVVTLNTDTSVDVRYTAVERAVTLNRGEAIFSVAHNKQRPFRVTAGSHVVQAVGTVFNVRRFGEEVRVTVSEGAVKVFDPAPSGSAVPEVMVKAGEVAVIDASGAHVNRIDATKIEASQAWQHGLLIYQGETLDTVITDISRYTNVRFEIEDDSIRSKRVGGLFRTGDVDGLLLALRESFGIDPRREGDVIYLSARKQ